MLNNIVDNIEQWGQHKAVFINPEQVVRFYACTRPHYVPVGDSVVLHADHFYDNVFWNIDILVEQECMQIL